ncbi:MULTISPECIES: hypothetical protein [Photorhabdus]|uniref:hypothetical protein n=1 Tax=Photorhabdus TaxID=29487 RepID=UPI000DCD056E|nr:MULTISPECIES: hypothetical protein [Photorhabdus]MCT8342034.1 hypothetical protein [Photorhabdus kleinii]RAX01468.1 hypothetical protein CKY03_06030 [Photorhabdus sp. S9-53]RAX02025.1 hypothetical protein CKY05_05270 [Photorhabdus sp. S10-54]RAX05159.1 hypothetical protein CKY04_06175 [Photorhabdus sp. S8-52]
MFKWFTLLITEYLLGLALLVGFVFRHSGFTSVLSMKPILHWFLGKLMAIVIGMAIVPVAQCDF